MGNEVNQEKIFNIGTFGLKLGLSLQAIVSVVLLWWVLDLARYGLDVTDESFYLIWISNPFDYDSSVSQFGFVYHPLYLLVDGDVAALRQINILITFSLAWGLGYVFLRNYFYEGVGAKSRILMAASLATLSILSFTFSGMWLASPSYNSLAFQGVLMAATGLVMVQRPSMPTSVAGLFLVGVGVLLAFLAKPTTGIALGFCSVVYLLIARKTTKRGAFLLLLGVLMGGVLAALAIDGSPAKFINRMVGGLETAKIIGGNSQDDLLKSNVLRFDALPYLVGVASLVLSVSVLQRTRPIWRVDGNNAAIFLFFLVCVAVALGFVQAVMSVGRYQGLLLWLLLPILIVVGVFVRRPDSALGRADLALIAIFFLLPFVYAFGTNNPYWANMLGAVIFCTIGALVLLTLMEPLRVRTTLLVSIVMALQIVAVAAIYGAAASPYRQGQSLWENTTEIEIGRSGAALSLSSRLGEYLTRARSLTDKAQFEAGTPMIDLSGRSPGLLYAIGARSVGLAWMMGGYPGSNALAMHVLSKTPCSDLARAWLVTEPSSPGKISSEVLNQFGAGENVDYEIVGEIEPPNGLGGHMDRRTQFLLRPTRDYQSAFEACIARRNQKQ